MITESDKQNIGMTLFRIQDLKRWQDRVTESASASGAGSIRKGSACQLWQPADLRPIAGTMLRSVEGVRVVRERIGRGVGVLAIVPRRMYFENGQEIPASTPERALLGERRLSLPPPAKRIHSCLEWAEWLARHFEGFEAKPIALERIRDNLHAKTQLIFGGGHRAPAGVKVSTMLMKCGFYAVPENLRIVMTYPECGQAKAKTYQVMIANALKRCHAHGVVSMSAYEDIEVRLQSERDAFSPGEVVLLAVTGHKGQPLSPAAEGLIQKMTERGVPFRMFSLDNPALNWSALDQVGTLISAAGGKPFVLDLPWPEHAPQPYLLGIDLGHPLRSRISHAVISLLDCQGTLIGSWKQEQMRDETFNPKALKQGLRWAVKTAQAHGGAANPDFLVLRDGRLFKGEPVSIYRRILGKRMSLVEFAKYDNPETFVDGATPAAAKAGTECVVAESDVRFITPLSPRLPGDLARTFKINMAPDWDWLNLGLDLVAEIGCGLSYAPGLGLAPHALPAPIYWADGIAAVGEKNHQFAGTAQWTVNRQRLR